MHTKPSPCTALKLAGPDAERYLNGQVSNDVRLATQENSVEALVTDAKGKLQAVIAIHRLEPESFLITAPVELRGDLHDRLDRYLIADDAEWTDVSDEFALAHVIGQVPDHSLTARTIPRFGSLGTDLLGPLADLQSLLCTDPLVDHDEIEALRISRSIPAWGQELVPGMLAQEAGIETTHISFAKGCYIGQEVISRIKSVGRVNRSLVQLQVTPSQDWTGADVLFEEKCMGEVTSSLAAENLALAFIHRKAINAPVFSLVKNGVVGSAQITHAEPVV